MATTISRPLTESASPTEAGTYGLMAEFETPEDLVRAAVKVREAGYRKVDAYTPFPVHGLAEALHFDDPRMPWTVFLSGVFGAAAGLGLQWYVHVIDNPFNIGGRPLFSLPAFVPVTFETTVLFASFGAVIGMLALNGLPMPHHPVFEARGFERASQDGFFLCIEAADTRFDLAKTAAFLRDAGAVQVNAVDMPGEGWGR